MNMLPTPLIMRDSHSEQVPINTWSPRSNNTVKKTHSRVKTRSSKSRLFVSEEVYWEVYYHDSDRCYEWNNGYLEEKPMPTRASYLMYKWFVNLLETFLEVHPIAKTMGLDMGFRLVLPHKRAIRKPDLGVVCRNNPIPLDDLKDESYQGTFDLCIEALSFSRPGEEKRDTVTKKQEYANGGVREYYILDSRGKKTAFYQLAAGGVYVPISPMQPDLICSSVLPGFQFRPSDLTRRPSVKEMSQDVIYQGFMGLDLQAERQATKDADQRAQLAESQIRLEKEARQATEAKLQELEAELAQFRGLGVQ